MAIQRPPLPYVAVFLLQLQLCQVSIQAYYVAHSTLIHRCLLQCESKSKLLPLRLSSDSEWAKALYENSGNDIGDFEKDMKLKGLMKGSANTNPKLSANQKLIEWLTRDGDVYLSEQSSWGEAPHPIASKEDDAVRSS